MNSNISTSIENITPDIAAHMLKQNRSNRPLRSSRVTEYARAMERGEWAMNGESIIIADDGAIMNGQHRLHAVIQSGVDCPMLIVRGVSRSAFETMDRGSRRTLGDVLATDGEANCNITAAAIGLFYRWSNSGSPYTGGLHPSASQARAILAAHPDLREHSRFAQNCRWTRRYMRPSFTAFFRYLCFVSDEEKADKFFDGLSTGAGLTQGSPILALRERLQASQQGKERITMAYIGAISFKAFRLHLDDAHIKTLRVRQSGTAQEKGTYLIPGTDHMREKHAKPRPRGLEASK